MRIKHALLILFIIILISLCVGGGFFLRSPYLLNQIRVVLENQLEKQIKQPLLFSLKLKFQSDLDNEIFPVELRRVFEKNGIPLPQNVKLSAKEKGSKWLVTDEDKQQGYTIRKETDALNVYKRLSRIGRLSGNILAGLTIQRFEIAAGESQNPPVISIDEVRFRYKLWGLLVGKLLVSDLSIKHPEINAYIQPNGKLNLTELIPEKKASSTKFPFQSAFSRIKVEDGVIHFADNNQNLKLTISGLNINIKGPLDKWKHRGDLEVRDGSFELNGVETQIDELKTEFEFLESQGELKELRLAMGNSVLIISGKTSYFKKKSPFVETRINLDLDLHDLQKFFPNSYDTEGMAHIDIEAKGTLSEITGQFGLKLPFARLNQIQLENLIAQAEFTQDTFRLTKIKGTLASGQLTGGAEIHTGKEGSSLSYDGWLEFAGIQAEELVPMLIGIPESFLVVKGDVNGKLQFNGDSQDAHDLRLSGDLQFTNATLNDVSIESSEANYQIADNRLKLTANFDEAQIQLAGTLGLKQDESGDPLNLDLNIQQIDAYKLTREILDVIDLTGNGTLTGKITSEIPIAGLLSIPKATLYDVPVGVLTADFHYKNGSVMLHPVRLAKGESEVLLEGVARITGDIPVDFTVHARPFQIADYVRLLAGGDYPIEGIATGQLTLDGTLNQLDGRGTLQIVNGKAWDLALDPLELPLEIENYVVKIQNFDLLTRGQRGVLDFQITTDGDYELSFQSERMRLAELARARGLTDFELDADLIIKATGATNISAPRVDVSFDFSDVSYAGKPLRDVHIDGIFMGDALSFEGIGFDRTSQIQGVLETTEGNPYQIYVQSKDIDVMPILRIFNDSLGNMKGTADGTLEIAGTLADLTKFALKIHLPTLSLHVNTQQLINSSPINFSFENDVWQIHSFALADVRAIDSPLLKAAGIFHVPPANQNITESPPGSKVQGRTLVAEFARIRDSAPSELLRVQLRANTIDFTVESEGFALEHLADILGLVPMVSGIASYKLTGTGTFENPQLTLDWSIPELTLKTPEEPITVSEAEGVFIYKDQGLIVEPFDFLLLGNPARVQGSMSIKPDDLPSSVANLQASISNFQLASLEQFAPQISELDGLLNLTAQFTGTLGHPKLTALIGINNATMKILDFSQPIQNMKVELEVSAGGTPDLSPGPSPTRRGEKEEENLSSDDLLMVALKSADWQLGDGQYRINGSWHLPKTEDQSSLISISDFNKGVNYQLQLEGRDVNLKHFVDYLMKREIPLIEGEVNLSLELSGNGYTPDGIEAFLRCDNLLLNINNDLVSNMEPMRFRFTESQLHIDSFRLGDTLRKVGSQEWFRTSGRIGVNSDLELDVKLTELPFAVLLPAITLPLFNNAIWLDGSLTSEITVRGDAANPIITAVWDARIESGDAPKIEDTGSVDYRNKLLIIQNTQLTGHGNQLTRKGRIPINLAFQAIDLADRFLDLPIDIQIKGENVNLDFLALYTPQLEASQGIADVNIRIKGTTASPYLYGNLSVRDAMLKLPYFDTPILSGKLDLKANRGKIEIPELSFQIGNGTYNAEMHLQMAGLVPTVFEVDRFKLMKAQIADFARNFLSGDVPRNLEGSVTGEANLTLPVNQFIIPGETAWIPKVIAVPNLQNFLKHATAELNIQRVLINSLGYEIRNITPIRMLLKENSLTQFRELLTHPSYTAFVGLRSQAERGNAETRKFLTLEGFTLASSGTVVGNNQGFKLTGYGIWDLTDEIRFGMSMENFDFAFVSDFIPDEYSVQGFLNSKLQIHGTATEPEITFQWNASDMSINHAKVNRCSGKIVYQNSKLYIGEAPKEIEKLLTDEIRGPVRFSIGANRANISGLIPLNISLLSFDANFLPQDIEGKLDIAIRDLEFLPQIMPQFGFAEGTGSISVTIGGPFDSPKLSGVAYLDNFAFDLPDSRIHVEKTEVNLDFTNHGINIHRFNGKLNGGTYQFRGSVQSDWHRIEYLDLSAVLRDNAIFEQFDYWFQCNEANLTMKGRVERNGTVRLPTLTGSMQITEGRYNQSWKELVKQWFDKESEIQFEVLSDYPILRDFQFDIDLLVPDNFWVVSDLGELEVEVSVNGKISGRIQKPIFNGRVDLLQGKFSFFALDYPFTLKEGSYIENENFFEFNPKYQINAETTHPIRGVTMLTTDGRARVKDIRVIVSLSGYLNQQPFPKFQAEVVRKGAGEEYQTLTEKQIISFLTPFGEFGEAETPTSETLWASLLLRSSQYYVGSQVAKAAGLSNVQLDISPDALEESRFLLTKELFERVFFTYASTFQIHAEPRIEVEYQINRHISIKGERNEQGIYGIDLQLEQRF